MADITKGQLGILWHTLGVRPDYRTPYRNYYVAGLGHHSMADLEALEAAGMMGRAPTPKFCDQSDIVFCCTEAGKAYALERLPEPPKLTRYGEWIAQDGSNTFAEFLGINKPRYEAREMYDHDLRRFVYSYRMCRAEDWWRHCPSIYGEWKPTKKEAKASYKAALKLQQARSREARKEAANA